MTVAFEIRRPWPQRESLPVTPGPRWRFRGCFWHIAGRRFYWPSLITIWHVEPGGHDAGDVCKHYRRTQGSDGKWTTTYLRGWRWHVHHWRIQVRPLQDLRRWALTRCEWCHGRSRKGDLVNHSNQWDGPRGKWWQGDPGLYHADCQSVEHAHRMCLCAEPAIPARLGYGRCERCGRFRGYGVDPRRLAQAVVYVSVRPGQRPTPEQVAEHAAHHERIKAQDAEEK